MRVTIKDIAKMSGLSITSVSLILNGKDVRVSAENRENVLRIAKQYGYIPNSYAVGLVTRRKNTVGLIVPDISNMFFSQVAKFMEKNLKEHGYRLILCNTDDSAEEENKYMKLMLSQVDALVVCQAHGNVGALDISNFKKNGIPVVAFDRYCENMDCPVVATDNKTGVKEAVKHLIALGHRRIACITGPIDGFSYASRFEGYKEALAEEGISFDEKLVCNGDYRFESGFSCTLQLLQQRPTALFACNDMMAFGSYKAIEQSGLKVPQDISVMGFDDLMFSSMLSAPLSSVKQNLEGMCDKMCSILYDALDGKTVENSVSLFKATPIYRESVKEAN